MFPSQIWQGKQNTNLENKCNEEAEEKDTERKK